MKDKQDKKKQINDLLQRMIDGEPNAETIEDLRKRLDSDPEAFEMYLDQMTLHAHLQWEFGGEFPSVSSFRDTLPGPAAAPNSINSGLRVHHRIGWVSAAANLILSFGLILGFLLTRQTAEITNRWDYFRRAILIGMLTL